MFRALIIFGTGLFLVACGDGKSPEEIAEDKRKGFHCLSAWDGSHRDVVTVVRSQLRDPESFEHEKTSITPINSEGNHSLFMTYRARNGFGGLTVGEAIATVSNSTCTAKIVSAE